LTRASRTPELPNELELRPYRFGRLTPLLPLATAVWCGWEALNLPEDELAFALVLAVLTLTLPLFTLGYVRNERLFVNQAVVGIDTFFGRRKTVPREEVSAFSTVASRFPSITLYRADGTRALTLRPAVFTTQQTDLLRRTLGFPGLPQPGVPVRTEIEQTADALILRPSAEIGWTAMTILSWLGFAVVVATVILVRSLAVGFPVAILAVLLVTELGVSSYLKNAQIFADSLVVGTRGLFGLRRSLRRDELTSIDIGRGGRSYVFRRNDGRTALSINSAWWSKEQIKVLTTFLALPDVTSDAYLTESLKSGMRPPRRN
jgi:hypothetical protein